MVLKFLKYICNIDDKKVRLAVCASLNENISFRRVCLYFILYNNYNFLLAIFVNLSIACANDLRDIFHINFAL